MATRQDLAVLNRRFDRTLGLGSCGLRDYWLIQHIQELSGTTKTTTGHADDRKFFDRRADAAWSLKSNDHRRSTPVAAKDAYGEHTAGCNNRAALQR